MKKPNKAFLSTDMEVLGINMFTRRSMFKVIFSAIAMTFASRNPLACDPTGPIDPIIVWTPKKHLLSFYLGKVSNFLTQEYKNRWKWNDDIAITKGRQIDRYDDLNFRKNVQGYNYYYPVENYWAAAVSVSSNIQYDTSKIYCSNIDIIYTDERSVDYYAIYIIAAVRIEKNALPFFSTRFVMSSNKPKIYAAFTFRDVNTNEIVETKVSSLPATYKLLSCVPYQFWYSDA